MRMRVLTHSIVAQMKQENLRHYLHLLEVVVEKAPNLLKLQIPCMEELTAERGVAHKILDSVAALTQLQALDMAGFHCTAQHLIEISNLKPNLR
jgi:hypothetical protein